MPDPSAATLAVAATATPPLGYLAAWNLPPWLALDGALADLLRSVESGFIDTNELEAQLAPTTATGRYLDIHARLNDLERFSFEDDATLRKRVLAKMNQRFNHRIGLEQHLTDLAGVACTITDLNRLLVENRLYLLDGRHAFDGTWKLGANNLGLYTFNGCHTFDGSWAFGPNLDGIAGSTIGAYRVEFASTPKVPMAWLTSELNRLRPPGTRPTITVAGDAGTCDWIDACVFVMDTTELLHKMAAADGESRDVTPYPMAVPDADGPVVRAPDNTLLIPTWDTLRKYTPDLTLLWSTNIAGYSYAAISTAPDGRIALARFGSAGVLILNGDGSQAHELEASDVSRVTFDETGNLYTLKATDNTVASWGPDYALRWTSVAFPNQPDRITASHGYVFVALRDGDLHKLDAATGEEYLSYAWPAPTTVDVMTALAAGQSRVYFADDDGDPTANPRYYALRAVEHFRGTPLWEVQMTSQVQDISIGTRGVYALTADGVMSLHDPATGAVTWSRKVADEGAYAAIIENDTGVCDGDAPPPPPQDFILAYQAMDSGPEGIAAYSLDGLNVWDNAFPKSFRLIPDGQEIIVLPETGNPQRLTVAGAQKWSWTPPHPDVNAYDAVPDGNGNTFIVYEWNNGLQIYKVDATGASTTVADIASNGLSTFGIARGIGLALSSDGAVLFALIDDWALRQTGIVGISVATGAVLWDLVLLTDKAVNNVTRYSVIRTKPGTDTIFVGATGMDPTATYNRVRVFRADFAGDTTTAPTVTWTREPQTEGHINAVGGFAVSGDGVYVGYLGDDNGTDLPHILTKYDHDGNIKWRLGHPDYSAWGTFVEYHTLFASDDRVLVGVTGDHETFPTWSEGFRLLNAKTGAPITIGAFPLLEGAVYAATIIDPSAVVDIMRDASLVAEYRFDDGSGKTLTDYSGQGNHATLGSGTEPGTNDPTWTAEGLAFDGVDDYIDIPDAVAATWPTGDYTQIVAFRMATSDVSAAVIGRSKEDSWWGGTLTQHSFEDHLSASVGEVLLPGALPMLDKMVIVDVSRAGTHGELGVDGVEDFATDEVYGGWEGATGFRFGMWNAFGQLTGTIAYAVFYNRGLTDAERAQTITKIAQVLEERAAA